MAIYARLFASIMFPTALVGLCYQAVAQPGFSKILWGAWLAVFVWLLVLVSWSRIRFLRVQVMARYFFISLALAHVSVFVRDWGVDLLLSPDLLIILLLLIAIVSFMALYEQVRVSRFHHQR